MTFKKKNHVKTDKTRVSELVVGLRNTEYKLSNSVCSVVIIEDLH